MIVIVRDRVVLIVRDRESDRYSSGQSGPYSSGQSSTTLSLNIRYARIQHKYTNGIYIAGQSGPCI